MQSSQAHSSPVQAQARATHSARILVVDDEPSMREFLSIMLKKQGHSVEVASGGLEALQMLSTSEYQLVITDLAMPRVDGMAVLQRSRELVPPPAVILITAYATTESAVEAMKRGAFDYIIKPFKIDELKLIIDKALETRRLVAENQELRQALESTKGYDQLVGRSRPMQALYELIRKVKDTRTNVLIVGESGTGKELVARAIHQQGPRREGPFVTVNCGAIPENLIESELFGYRKGAFTGATANKIGLFQAAEGGTLFLDEVGDMPLATQVKVLRALQERTFKALGGVEDIRVDVRVLAATNRDLEQDVKSGRFREDLYYRLNVIQLRLPPLRERLEDLPALAEHFLARFGQEYERPLRGFQDDALRALMAWHFPGNIRELGNIIERAVALESSERITLGSLPAHLQGTLAGPPALRLLELPPEGVDLDAFLAEVERQLITQALERTGGVRKRAARLLRVSFRSIRYRLAKLGLDAAVEGEDEDEG